MEHSFQEIFFLKQKEIDSALALHQRIYFAGDLKRPQESPDYINLGALEIGSTLYETARADIPHLHHKSSEIIYVLKGQYDILVLDTQKEYHICAGDFFVLPPNTAYAGKGKAGTQTFFIKYGGNDKEPVEADDATRSWLNNFDSE